MQWWENLVDIVERGAKAKKKLEAAMAELDFTGLPPELDARVQRLAHWSSHRVGRRVSKLQLLETLVTLAEKEACKVQSLQNNHAPFRPSVAQGGPSSKRKA